MVLLEMQTFLEQWMHAMPTSLSPCQSASMVLNGLNGTKCPVNSLLLTEATGIPKT